MREARFDVPGGYDLAGSFVLQRVGRSDPTGRLEPGRFAKGGRTPEGLVSVELVHEEAARTVRATAWGPGADWLLARVGAWLGDGDRPEAFVPPPGALARLAAQHRGLRLPRSPFPAEIHAGLVMQQRVTWGEAVASFHRLARDLGEPAPGPLDLRVFPDHAALRGIPSYEATRMGIDGKRWRGLVEGARLADRVTRLMGSPSDAIRRYLHAIPGTGPWTTENMLAVAFGDPDAVPPGDVNLPHQICYALAGEPHGSDERMMELLEPYRGHRNRVVRLIYLGGPTRPKIDRGPPQGLRRSR